MVKRGLVLFLTVALTLCCATRIYTVEEKGVWFKQCVHEALHDLGMLETDIKVDIVEADVILIVNRPEADAALFQLPKRVESPEFAIAIKKSLLKAYDKHMLRHVATHEVCHAYLISVGNNTELNAEKCVYFTHGEKSFVTTYMKLWKDHPVLGKMDYNELRSTIIPTVLELEK